jgi:hypothetical protein
MRKSFAAVLTALAAVLVAGPSTAGQLTSSFFSFKIGTLPAANFNGSGTTGTATSNLSVAIDAGSTIVGTVTTPVTDPAAVPITNIQAILTANANGAFTGTTPNDVGGSASFTGVANVKGFGGLTLLGVPLDVGSGATTTAGAYGINITATSGTWTTGAAAVAGVPSVPTVTVTGTNNLSPSGGGAVTLVAPITIISNLSGGTNFPAFATLVLNYAAPEPGAMIAMGGAIATLCALGFRRRRA